MTSPAITINAKPKQPVSITLVGVEYEVKVPKSSILLLVSQHASGGKGKKRDTAALQRDIDTILQLMFGKEKDAVQKRLVDPDDELDIDHIFEAVGAVVEFATGNPTSQPDA